MFNSLPGLLFVSHNGGTKEVKELIGKMFNSVNSSNDYVLAVCNDGVYGVTDEVKSLSPLTFQIVSGDKGFFIGTDTNGTLYSWGNNGSNGQLGQGICYQNRNEPHKIKHNAIFLSTSSGENFSLGLDNLGNVYAWGENYDRQLGLYTKDKKQMSLQNSMIEEMVYQPRLVSLSQKFPVMKVSCGSRYALIVTKTGCLYSWGAGECGQLGTGMCTRKEVPSQVFLPDDLGIAKKIPLLVKDVSTGIAHVLVVSLEGDVYSWGLNSSAQLGIGHLKAKHFPCKVNLFLNKLKMNEFEEILDASLSDVQIVKVSAGGHSSAAIDNNGRLFTWGSTCYDRLMHELPPQKFVPVALDPALSLVSPQSSRARIAQAAQDAAMQSLALGKKITSIEFPTMVKTIHITNRKVENFAFSKMYSTALVLTSFIQLSPAQGPKRSFSKLTIYGDGFWDSPIIIVKFTFKKPLLNKSGFIDSNVGKKPPRSCSAKFLDPGTLTCKPPKFPEAGWFTVSISMDGVNFLIQTVDLLIHDELSVKSQIPALLDIRSLKLDTLQLSVTGIPILPSNWNINYDIRLVFSNIEENNKHHNIIDDIIVNAIACVAPTNDIEQVDPVSEQDSVTELICKDIDLSCFQNKLDTGLYEMRCQISTNGQDFSNFKVKSYLPRQGLSSHGGESDIGVTTESNEPCTLAYAFTPHTVYPSCIPIESNDLSDVMIEVFGTGFIPMVRLSKGSQIVITLTPLVEQIKWDPMAISVSETVISSISLNSLLTTVKCDSSNKLTCNLNSNILEQIQKMIEILNEATFDALKSKENDSCQVVEILPMKLSFDLQLPDRIIPLINSMDYELKPLQINFYKNQSLLLIPNCMNLRNVSATKFSILVNRSSFADGFDFISQDIKVAIHIPIVEEANSEHGSQKFYPPILLEKSHTSVNELKGPDETSSSLYVVQCEVQYLSHYLEYIKSTAIENVNVEVIDQYSCMYLSVLLDGKSFPPERLWTKIILYRDLAKQYSLLPAVAPKTGFTPGTTITLQLTSFIPLSSTLTDNLSSLLSEENTPKPQQCIVCIRGASTETVDGAEFNFPGKLISLVDSNTSNIEFIIPDGIRVIPGMSAVQKTPKDKPMFYVDISLDDGITFDKAELPLLNIK